ncbi:unnamed protein product [Penicillium salamii]|nr:unnamed protein product [Penicillium salamii]
MVSFNNVTIPARRTDLLHLKRTLYRMECGQCSSQDGLPNIIIVKVQKQGWEDEFAQEIAAYHRLQPLQGLLIPKFFGTGYFMDRPALVISEIVGNTLERLAQSKLDFSRDVLESQLTIALRTFYDRGVEYWDDRLDNFFFCEKE